MTSLLESRLRALDARAYALPATTLDRLLTPALVVYLDRVGDNVRALLRRLGGDAGRLRLHVKTTKLPRVWAELLASGLRSFKCATTREAACFLAAAREAGIAVDLLVAYPHRGPALLRLAELARAHPDCRLSVLCEDPELMVSIPPQLGVFADIDSGMHRTGVAIEDRATIRALVERAGARFGGLHFYEGHVARGSFAERRARCAPLYDALCALCAELQRGLAIPEVVTSGTPTFACALAHDGLRQLGSHGSTMHRVSPGTVVFADTRTLAFDELDFVPAALVAARVVSWPTPTSATCDAGSKALAAEAGDPCALALGWPGLVAQKPSEEHLPFEVESGARPPRGDVLLLVPRHVCPTVNLAEEALLVADGREVGTFPVSARAHDLRT